MATYSGALLPNAEQLDAMLSQRIQELLNPPETFADTSRQSAELAAARGIPGSAAAFGTGLRMTDEERLKRIAMGEQLMSSAYGRNLPLTITPSQQAQLDLSGEELKVKQAEEARLRQAQAFQQQYLNQQRADQMFQVQLQASNQRTAASRVAPITTLPPNARLTSGVPSSGNFSYFTPSEYAGRWGW